jgi:hypothetical protein
MLSPAMAFANEISKQFTATTGIDVKIAVPVGGNPSRIAWIANYENLAQFEAAGLKLLADQKYMERPRRQRAYWCPIRFMMKYGERFE